MDTVGEKKELGSEHNQEGNLMLLNLGFHTSGRPRKAVFIGGRGELGTSLSSALRKNGFEVLVATRRPQSNQTSHLDMATLRDSLTSIAPDLLIISSSVGNNREATFIGPEILEDVIRVANTMEVRIILLSSIRVLEGYSGMVEEDASASPISAYAWRNSVYENFLLENCGTNLTILRVSNFFSAPSNFDSPQSAALPWSFMNSALMQKPIFVRSFASDLLEYVSPTDLSDILTILLDELPESRISATVPGFRKSLGQIVMMVADVAHKLEKAEPVVQYLETHSKNFEFAESWLAGKGWRSQLDDYEMMSGLLQWGQQWLVSR